MSVVYVLLNHSGVHELGGDEQAHPRHSQTEGQPQATHAGVMRTGMEKGWKGQDWIG